MKANTIRILAAAIAVTSMALPVSGALAHGGDNSTCSDLAFLGVHVHGDHVIRDYVKGPDGTVGHGQGAYLPGGPGPGFHFTIEGLAPGASFCNSQAHPNGFTTPSNVPVPGNR
ncbi:MAG: hypothetical protein ABIP13_09985 [Tepidiformaceae bacterium]